MFGIWRTLLAIEVVAFHLFFVPFIGAYAVFSFFVLSGFLMTAIMHGTYGYGTGGFARYIGNRALRLYPNYWFALAVSIALILIVGGPTVVAYHPAIALPTTVVGWAENISMLFLNIVPRDVLPRLVPLTWALTVEIVFYILIGLGISRTRGLTWLWLAASVAYIMFAQTLRHPRDAIDEIIPIYQYSAIPAGSLPFAVGAIVWHYRGEIRRWLPASAAFLVVTRWTLYLGIVAAFALLNWVPLVMIGNWLNIAISGLIVCALFHVRPAQNIRRIDKAIGDFSYPIYLLHLQLGLVAALILFGGPVTGRSLKSFAVFGLGLGLTILVGAICARLIDPAIERLRTRIKQSAA
jgi:peptidoglycan/LPS O-acetylase OafA/YrhL